MSRETLTGLSRLLDHLSLGLAALAALSLALLAQPRWLGAVLAAALAFASLALLWARQRRELRERNTWNAYFDAQARLAELLLPVWQAQIDMAGQHCAQATEGMAGRLANAVMTIGRPLPQVAYTGDCAGAWQRERELLLSELAECTTQLQFQDRVDQILSHVRASVAGCREGLEQANRHFETAGTPLPLDVDGLLDLLEASYATDEERVVHQGHLSVADRPLHPPAATTAITYF